MQRLGRIGAATFTTAQAQKRSPRQSPHRSGIGTWHASDPVVGEAVGALVAAASQGPVPQLLWMMASIMDDARPLVNAAGADTPSEPSPEEPAGPRIRRRRSRGRRGARADGADEADEAELAVDTDDADDADGGTARGRGQKKQIGHRRDDGVRGAGDEVTAGGPTASAPAANGQEMSGSRSGHPPFPPPADVSDDEGMPTVPLRTKGPTNRVRDARSARLVGAKGPVALGLHPGPQRGRHHRPHRGIDLSTLTADGRGFPWSTK